MTDILNLPKWDVIELEEGHDEYLITVRYTVRPSACPACGVMFPRVHRYGTKRQPYRDLPIHGKRVRLVVEKKRWKCLECNHIFLEQLDDLDDHHRATRRLVEWVQDKALERPFTHLAAEIGVDEGTIRHVFNRHVADLEASIAFQTPRWLGIDELHLLGKPRCVLVNIEARTLIDLLEGRKGPSVARRLMSFKDRNSIELVAIDMWSPYRDAVKGVLPQAVIVIDKFHVLRMVNAAVDRVRKGIRERLTDRQRRTLMHDRHLLFRRKKDLEPEKYLLLETWLNEFGDLKAAYEAKEELYDLWDTATTSAAARKAYGEWRERTTARGVLWAYSDVVTAITNWDAEIFAYFDHRVTNAATEALNGLTRVTNRLGRGYSFRAIRAKMLYAARNQRPAPDRKEVVAVHESVDKFASIEPLISIGIDLDTLELVLFLRTNSTTPEEIQRQKDLEATFYQKVGRFARHGDSTHKSE